MSVLVGQQVSQGRTEVLRDGFGNMTKLTVDGCKE